ncbi:MAG TPA: hypothetical protein VFG30_41255 [Polyangiales bacterium]|nr:hypothetical protein [Polyangiales bacterium]
MLRSAFFVRVRAPLAVFAACAAIYVATLGRRALGPSDNTHFVNLALSLLHGQASVWGDRPPGTNDWAFFEGKWFVSFPAFPAVVIMPAVLVWGDRVWDPLYWAILAGLGPALIYVLLRYLRESAETGRTARDDLALTALFAFGSAYYFTAVQGTVWFAAHVVAVPLTAAFLLFGLRARRPLLAGCMLALCFWTRPSTMFLALLFAIEALDVTRRTSPEAAAPESWIAVLGRWLRSLDFARALPRLALFALPIAIAGGLAMWFNAARFHDPFEFGHTYLRIRWKGRIDKWGLANYHYLAKNLAVFLAALPWISAVSPYLRVSRHGLALWFTTPHYLGVLWPKRVNVTYVALALAAGAVAIVDLCYQNSGWIQFAYRFSLDYAVLLAAMLAIGGRKQGLGWYALFVFAIAVNLFGAITFDRAPLFYDQDSTQNVIFQPD